jgi:hypothetical protein
MNLDQGTDFGIWTDSVSRFMYNTSSRAFFGVIDFEHNEKVGDYGGANSLLKNILPNWINYTSIDMDESKKPDIVDDIITHKGNYDTVILRYVIHYLNDSQVIELFKNIKANRILVQQFFNKDTILKSKFDPMGYRFFRNRQEFNNLIGFAGKDIGKIEYDVTDEFYSNRFNLPCKPVKHKETVEFFEIN